MSHSNFPGTSVLVSSAGSGAWLRFFGIVLVSLGVLFAGLSTATAQQPAVKIGYVDFQKALNEIEEGKRVKAQLEREFRQRQQQLDQKQNQVVQLKEQLESQGMMLSEAARREKAMEFQQSMAELQQLYMTLQSELAQKEAEATKRIFDKMREIIAEIGREQSYTMVFEKTESAVLFARDGLDLTDELIKRYNAKK
jgi:outer membrane protein